MSRSTATATAARTRPLEQPMRRPGEDRRLLPALRGRGRRSGGRPTPEPGHGGSWPPTHGDREGARRAGRTAPRRRPRKRRRHGARARLPSRADRVVTIPHGLDHDVSATPTVSGRYVLGVGRLAAEKGFDVLIDAVAAAKIDLDLVLAGDGPARIALATRAADRGL